MGFRYRVFLKNALFYIASVMKMVPLLYTFLIITIPKNPQLGSRGNRFQETHCYFKATLSYHVRWGMLLDSSFEIIKRVLIFATHLSLRKKKIWKTSIKMFGPSPHDGRARHRKTFFDILTKGVFSLTIFGCILGWCKTYDFDK